MTHLETLKVMSANDHINVLKVMLKDSIGFPHLAEDCAALTAAIAAMEAVKNAQRERVSNAGTVSRVSAWLPKELAGKEVLILPADAVGGE